MRFFYLFLIFVAVPVYAAPAVQIMPHRAVYKVVLDHVRAGSGISNVSGTMLFDWADACDGWAIQQKLTLHVSDREHDDIEIDSATAMWESKDGKAYNFYLRHMINGAEDEKYQGHAEIKDDSGKAIYTVPKEKAPIKLSVKTVFPAGHTKKILQKAQQGETFFSMPVFDGTDKAGYADVSAFISPSRKSDLTLLPAKLAKHKLIKKKFWPVRLAFFGPDSQTSAPDYEMDIELQENGVAHSMRIDYGEFSIKGKLVSLEIPEGTVCPK